MKNNAKKDREPIIYFMRDQFCVAVTEVLTERAEFWPLPGGGVEQFIHILQGRV